MNTRIICVGNRFVEEDSAGPRVHDHLAQAGVPEGVDLVDGGLAGLDLLPLVEECHRVVFVDNVIGFDAQDGVIVLGPAEAAEFASPAYDHGAGLAYLLKVMPGVIEGPLPEVFLVGVEDAPDPGKVEAAAHRAVALALHGATEKEKQRMEVVKQES
jgi:hydrogenase maturation protease